MVQFNVPFLDDARYTDYLVSQKSRIQAVHFPLYDTSLKDARVELGKSSAGKIAAQLKRLQGPKKYLLANARIHAARLYTDKNAFSPLAAKLELLLEENILDGIIYADSYMLTAMGRALPAIAERLEAVPSINFGINSIERLHPLIELAEQCGFRRPAKITLDRDLNRQPERLQQLIQTIKTSYPKLSVEVLANEGCLPHCPFRASHECMISMANLLDNSGGYDTHNINTSLACRKMLLDEPHRFLASPFIRPEEVARMSELGADVIKLCGRTLGPRFLHNCLQAYFSGHYDGNLTALMDAANWMQHYVFLDNTSLPDNMYLLLASCSRNCSSCTICRQIFDQASSPVDYQLTDLRSRQQDSHQ